MQVNSNYLEYVLNESSPGMQNPMSAHMLDQLTATVDQSMIKFHSHY